MVKQSLVEPSFHTRYVNYQKLFRLQRQCQEKKKKSDAFSLTLFLKGKKWEHVFFSPAISKAYILICSAAQYQLGVVYLM